MTSTVFGSTFDFECGSGFTLNGGSDSLNNATVTCLLDLDSLGVDTSGLNHYLAGYWDLGDLRCEGNH